MFSERVGWTLANLKKEEIFWIVGIISLWKPPLELDYSANVYRFEGGPSDGKIQSGQTGINFLEQKETLLTERLEISKPSLLLH